MVKRTDFISNVNCTKPVLELYHILSFCQFQIILILLKVFVENLNLRDSFHYNAA
jgi:hypothetical protein